MNTCTNFGERPARGGKQTMKRVPWILFSLSLIGTLYLFGLLLNAGSILGDARSEEAHLRERSDLALTIVRKDWVGKEATSVVALSRQLEQNGVIVGTEGSSIKIGDFIFDSKDGLITGVRYMH